MNENACIGVNDMLDGHTSCKQKRSRFHKISWNRLLLANSAIQGPLCGPLCQHHPLAFTTSINAFA